jgi:hypothetical protein
MRVEKISLSIPCLVLSSETSISGEIEKHMLTPFGYIDIIFPSALAQEHESTPIEIKVVGDIDSWMIDDSMPVEFKVVLRKFIVEMVQLCTQTSLPRSIKNALRLQNENQNIKVILTK